MSGADYLIVGLVAVAAAYILWARIASGKPVGKPVDPLDSALPGLAAHRNKAVIYCYSRHCRPCRKMSPAIDGLQERHPNVFKLDLAQHAGESRAIGIGATPTTLLVEGGKVSKVLVGAGAIPAIEEFLESG